MSLGTWDPNTPTPENETLLQPALLRRLIGYAEQERLLQLEQLLNDEEKQQLAGLMAIDHASWRETAAGLEDRDIVQLIRFFAVAENLPGWEAGPDSPVIPLARVLRQRGMRLDKPLLQWLREVNDNRFLPYGPL